jgi:dipeptidase
LSPAYAPVGDQKETVPLGTIPQVEETYGYWDIAYGMQNEFGLSMAESTCNAKTVGFPATPDKPYGYNHVGINDLSKIGLERCKTARCAIKTMGDIAVEQGFFSEDSGTAEKPDYMDSAEALAIADAETGELWIFNIMTGKGNRSAIWAAQRVPDDHVTSIGNSFTIRKMNLTDTDNFMYSDGVSDLATEMGWWDPAIHELNTFDFFGSYGTTPPKPRAEMTIRFYAGRRMWRVWNLLTPEEGAKLDPSVGHLPGTKQPYPFSLPAKKASVTYGMVKQVMRDHYEGTPFDLTKGMAAGPFGNPNRGASMPKGVDGEWERAISMHRTSWSFICVLKPNKRSLVWMGWDAPHGTAYLPVYGAADIAPDSFVSIDGHMSKFSTKVAWWAFNFVNQYQDKNFKLINAEVRAVATEFEMQAEQLVAKWEARDAPISELNQLANELIADVMANWWQFAWSLVAKYGRYVITYNESEHGQGHQSYPAWWATSPEVGYTLFTPEGPNFGRTASSSAEGVSVVLAVSIALASSVLAALAAFIVGRRSARGAAVVGQRTRAPLVADGSELA